MKIRLLDKDTIVIDNSRASCFLACPRKGQYVLNDHRIASGERDPLNFGNAIHAAMQLRYRMCGAGPLVLTTEERQLYLLRKWWEVKPTSFGNHRTLDLACRLIRGYNTRYPEEDFQLLQVKNKILLEEAFAVPLGTIGRYKIVWSGRIDLPIQRVGSIWVMDHKTSSVGGEFAAKDYRMSGGLKGYAWTLRELYGLNVSGAIVNMLIAHKPAKTARAKTPQIEFERYVNHYSPELLEDWRINTLHIVNDIIGCAQRDYWPMHTTQCFGTFGPCEYLDVCSLDPVAREAMLNSELFQDDEWTPFSKAPVDIDAIIAMPADALPQVVTTEPEPDVVAPNLDAFIDDIMKG